MFPECIDDNSLARVLKELTRGDALLDLILRNGEELVRNDHETVELRQNSRTTTLDIMKADFDLFRGLRDQLGRILWGIVLKRSPREFFDFQGSLPKSLRTVHPDSRNPSRSGRKPAWMNPAALD